MTQKTVLKEQGRRLRQARIRKGLETAIKAAEYLGVSVGTYRNHERGATSMATMVEQYATRLAVSPEWIVWGREGTREPASVEKPKPTRAPVTGDTRTVAMNFVTDRSGRLGDAETVELPEGAPSTAQVVIVRGDGMRPTYDDGMVLLYWNHEARPRAAIGANCVVALRGGPGVLARIEPGPRAETWTLFNVNGTGVISYDVMIDWAAPIEMVLRSSRWHEVWPGDAVTEGDGEYE